MGRMLMLLLWVGLGFGCIQAPPQSLPVFEDMSNTEDMGSDEGQDDIDMFTEPEQPTCNDGTKNQDETGIDCGGPNCGGCALDNPCENNDDCQSGRCVIGFCAVDDACLVSEMVTPQAAYDSGCMSIQFPEGVFEIPFVIERSIELSGAGENTRLGKVLLTGASDQAQFLISQLSFMELSEGAIEHQGGRLSVVDVLFKGNSIEGQNLGKGGAIYSEGTGLELTNCEFDSNSANQGGAVYANYPSQGEFVSIVGSSFTKNSASESGGAIFLEGGGALVAASSFTQNVVNGQSGGAIHVEGLGVGSLRIREANFIQNSVSSNDLAAGGAISIRRQNLEIAESYFMENQTVGSSGIGGAIAGDEASIAVVQSTFRSNSVVGNLGFSRGAAIHGQGVSEGLILVNSTLSGQQVNGANPQGSALFLNGMSFESFSNTFSENDGESVIVGSQAPGSESLTITDNTIYGDLVGPTFPEAMVWSGRNIIAEMIDPEGKFNVGDPELGDILEIEGAWVHVPVQGSLPRTLAGVCVGPRGDPHLQQDQLKQPRPVDNCTIGAVQVFEVE